MNNNVTILNLTQHPATPDQVAAGVVEPAPGLKARIRAQLTVDALPDAEALRDRCDELVELVFAGNDELPEATASIARVMIGGAPFLMSYLEDALLGAGFEPVYAFSTRESVEEVQPDCSVVKRQVFRHQGFVRPHADDPRLA